jgi:hypothetical protein
LNATSPYQQAPARRHPSRDAEESRIVEGVADAPYELDRASLIDWSLLNPIRNAAARNELDNHVRRPPYAPKS